MQTSNDVEVDEEYLTVETDYFLNDSFDGPKARYFFNIHPISSNWDYTLLSVFLNHFPNFIPSIRQAFQTGIVNDDFHTKYTFHHIFDRSLNFNIKIGNEIMVTVSLPFLKLIFEKKKSKFYSKLGKGQKMRKFAVYQEHECYTLTISELNDASKALYNHKPLIFCSKYDFTRIFKFFCKKIKKVGFPSNSDTQSIQDFVSLFVKDKEEIINSLEMLKQKTKGYLLLDIQQSNINKRKPKIEYKGQTYYVIGCTYILPFTKSILSDYQEIINGLLLDTTFKILPSFVTSIQGFHSHLHSVKQKTNNYTKNISNLLKNK